MMEKQEIFSKYDLLFSEVISLFCDKYYLKKPKRLCSRKIHQIDQIIIQSSLKISINVSVECNNVEKLLNYRNKLRC